MKPTSTTGWLSVDIWPQNKAGSGYKFELNPNEQIAFVPKHKQMFFVKILKTWYQDVVVGE